MGVFKKLKKKAKKKAKKAGKAVKDTAKDAGKAVEDGADAAGDAAKDAAKDVSRAARYAGKKFNKATGAIEEAVDDALDYAEKDLATAAKYANKQLKKGADWVADLAQDAIEAAYREAYKNSVGDYVKFVTALSEAQYKIFSKPDNILTAIRDNLLTGKFSRAEDDVLELLDSNAMARPLDAGRNLFGTSFIFAADLSFGGGASFVTAGGSGSIGMSCMLDNFEKYKYRACVFAAAGGAIGASTDAKPSASGELGLSMGFLVKDPRNISGWFIDLSGAGTAKNSVYGLGLSWSPPGKKPPYLKPVPQAGICRVGFSTSADPGGSVTIGGSYTWIIQKIKNNLYRG